MKIVIAKSIRAAVSNPIQNNEFAGDKIKITYDHSSMYKLGTVSFNALLIIGKIVRNETGTGSPATLAFSLLCTVPFAAGGQRFATWSCPIS